MTKKATTPDFSKETLAEAREPFFTYLQTERNCSEPTIYTYNMDWKLITRFFKPEKQVQRILPAHVGSFMKSDILLKKPNGEDRAKPSRDKTSRLLRMFFDWCVATGRLKKAPIPKDAQMGSRSIQEIEASRAKAKERREAKRKRRKPDNDLAPEPGEAKIVGTEPVQEPKAEAPAVEKAEKEPALTEA